MKKTAYFFFFIFSVLIFAFFLAPKAYAASCTSGASAQQGGTLTVQGSGFGTTSYQFGIVTGFGSNDTPLFNTTNGQDSFNTVVGIPAGTQIGTWRLYVNTSPRTNCSSTSSDGITFQVNAGSGGGSGGGNPSIGEINPIQSIPSIQGNPSNFVASIIRSSISLLLIVAFIIDLLWTIFAGLRFITASGDPKSTGAAWSQIYWGMIGMLVVLGSFAIIKVVEIFFRVNILSGGLQLPTI